VLAWVKEKGMPLSIELKRPSAALGRADYSDLPARVLELVKQTACLEACCSFRTITARPTSSRAGPDIATSFTLGGATYLDPVGLARKAGADGISVHWSYASRQFVDQCHAANLHIFGFGVGEDLTRVVELQAVLATAQTSLAAERLIGFARWSKRGRLVSALGELFNHWNMTVHTPISAATTLTNIGGCRRCQARCRRMPANGHW
jgi:hypothetical protein